MLKIILSQSRLCSRADFFLGATSNSSGMLSTDSHLDTSSSCTVADKEVSPVLMDQSVLTCSSNLEQETDVICLSSDEEQVDHPPEGEVFKCPSHLLQTM